MNKNRVIKFLFTALLIASQCAAQITVQNAGKINSPSFEFSPTPWLGHVIYVSEDASISEITGAPHFDLYVSALGEDDRLDRSAKLARELNGPTHEGPASWCPRDSTLYFSKVVVHGFHESLPPSKLFSSKHNNGFWSTPSMLEPGKDDSANYYHPAISEDGQILVFASDMNDPGGQVDLFVMYRQDNVWSDPEPLISQINSHRDEAFPFIDHQFNLFFARAEPDSGFDIYLAPRGEDRWEKPIPLPPPVNSAYNDFGLSFSPHFDIGYFSSDRPGGKGKDDIYTFFPVTGIFPENEKEQTKKVGFEVVNELGRKLPSAQVQISALVEDKGRIIDPFDPDRDNLEILSTVETNRYGYAELDLFPGIYLIEVFYPGKKTWSRTMIHEKEDDIITVLLKDLPESGFTSEDTLGQINVLSADDLQVGAVITFNNIYYDYNSADIKKGAAYELDALVAAMKKNPSIIVELRAHTDARGDAEYNLLLSQKRAAAARKYLVDKGVNPLNIRTVGFGESRIRNHCRDGVDCSEADHIYNRRTEVVILAK